MILHCKSIIFLNFADFSMKSCTATVSFKAQMLNLYEKSQKIWKIFFLKTQESVTISEKLWVHYGCSVLKAESDGAEKGQSEPRGLCSLG